ncbi:hypothetical protein EMMF5_001554 [Cystobasidiomycetes sp. EMM_F5]
MANAGSSSSRLRFKGHHNLRYRILLSILSQRPLLVTEIRANADNPGIKDFEVSFLRLIERLTNGTLVEINYTGTEIYVKPGMLLGGSVVHQCPESRAVGWFLEPCLVLGLFGKQDLKLTLRGVTSNDRDVSADTLRTSYLPHLSSFIPATVTVPLELRILKRGLLPGGGGEIVYSSPSIRAVKAGYDFTSPGSITKIRGLAHCVRVNPQFAQRLVNGAKEVLSPLCSDTRIYTDVYRGQESGKSPGYGLTLVASSTTQAVHSAEAVSAPTTAAPGQAGSITPAPQQTPEELGASAAFALLSQLDRGSCVDAGIEWMVCLLMALGSEDVGRVRLAGPFDPQLVLFLRDLKDILGVTMKIRPHEELKDVHLVSCVGIGFTNIAKKS